MVWQALMGPIMQAAVNRSEFQFDRLTGQDNTFEQPWGKGPYWNAKTITDLQGQQFDTAVASAKRNKLHPLFALGSSANFSPTLGSVPQGRSTRRPPGVDAPRFVKASAMQERALAAQASNDEAQAMYWRARAAQVAQAPGGAPDASPQAGAGVKVYPLRRHSSEVSRRPLVEGPRQSVPERIELVDEQGRRIMSLNPDAGLDEVGQAEYLRQKAVQAVSELLTERARLVRAKKARDASSRERHVERTKGIRRAFKR